MKLKRFITQEEYDKLNKIISNEVLQSDEAYSFIRKEDLKDKEDFKYIEKILKECIEGFSWFKSIVEKNKFRLEYDYNYKTGYNPFNGVGYITIDELKNGF